MIKYFCDVCGNEIKRNYADERLCRRLGDFGVEVLVSFRGISNKGEICLHCLMEVLTRGEDIDDC